MDTFFSCVSSSKTWKITDRQTDRQTDGQTDKQNHFLSQADTLTKNKVQQFWFGRLVSVYIAQFGTFRSHYSCPDGVSGRVVIYDNSVS